MDMVEFKPGSEAVDYIRVSLADGRTLSHLILDSCDLDQGQVVTRLPKDTDPATITQFHVGGRLLRPGKLPSEQPYVGPEADVWLASEIRAFLKGENTQIVVFENASASPDDPWLATRHAQIFTYMYDVYHFLTNRDKNRSIRQGIRDATSWLFVGSMSSVAPDTTFPQQSQIATYDQIRMIAERTERIIVSAYDYEGYLIWTRRR